MSGAPKPMASDPPLVRRFYQARQVFDRVLITIAATLFVVGVGATFVGALGRQFPTVLTNVTWSIEVTVYAIITAVLLVIPMGLRSGTQMAVTMIPERLAARPFRVLTVVNQLLMVSFFVILAYYGYRVAGLNQNQRSPILGLSLFWPYLVIAVSGTLMLIESVVRIVETFAGRVEPPHVRVADGVAAQPEEI